MSPYRTRRVNALINDLEDGDEYYRELAARRLGKLGDPRAVQALVNALDDASNKIREAAAEALMELGDNRAVEILQSELKDKNLSVQRRAAFALIGLKPDLGTLALLEEMEQDEAVKKLRFNLILDADRTVVSVQEIIQEVEDRLEGEQVDEGDIERLARGTRRLKKARAVAEATLDTKLQDHVELALNTLNETSTQAQEQLEARYADKMEPVPPAVNLDFMAELEKLVKWKEEGVLNEEDFEAAKGKLLGQ